MLLDSPKRPAESRGFVHKRIGGAIGGLLSGGPVGAIGGFLTGGGDPVIPTGSTDFTTTTRNGARASDTAPCPGLWSVRYQGKCIDLTALGPGGRPAITGQDPRTADRFDPLTHHPHEPFLDAVTVRRCSKGHVLSYQGLCVSKKELKNSDRMYPKPPRPLGTRSELKAVRVASSFGKRLKKNEKRLAKLGRALGSSSRGRY